MTFRAFIAVELSGLEQVGALIEEMRSLQAPLKLVAVENMHVTLKFLGDTPEPRVPEIMDVVRSACAGTPPFDIGYKSMGAFPTQKKMNVVWAGITGADPMMDIALKIDEGLGALGFPREKRPFKPHLTLARLRKYAKLDERAQQGMQDMFKTYRDRDLGGCTVDRVVLKKSTLTPQGPIYEDVEEVRLSPAGQ